MSLMLDIVLKFRFEKKIKYYMPKLGTAGVTNTSRFVTAAHLQSTD